MLNCTLNSCTPTLARHVRVVSVRPSSRGSYDAENIISGQTLSRYKGETPYYVLKDANGQPVLLTDNHGHQMKSVTCK